MTLCYVSNDTERHLFILLFIIIYFLAPIPDWLGWLWASNAFIMEKHSHCFAIIRHENGSRVKKVRRIQSLLEGLGAISPGENFEYFIFKSINVMHFERKIKQNYKTVWMYNKVSIYTWSHYAAPSSCALLFDSVPAVHGCPCLHS